MASNKGGQGNSSPQRARMQQLRTGNPGPSKSMGKNTIDPSKGAGGQPASMAKPKPYKSGPSPHRGAKDNSYDG